MTLQEILELTALAEKTYLAYTDAASEYINNNKSGAAALLQDAGYLCDRLHVETDLCLDKRERTPDSLEPKNILNGDFFYDPDKNQIRITLPGRLPSRPKQNGRQTIWISQYKRDIKSTFAYLFRGLDRNLGPKIHLHFYLHYKDARTMKDHDNVDPKPIIDEITYYLLPDDSPSHLSLSFDGVSDGQDLIEIIIRAVTNKD